MQPELLHIKGETFVALSDPAKIWPEPILLSPLGYQLTQLMDGLRSRAEIAAEAGRRWGVSLPQDQLEGFLDSLEERYVLDNSRSRGYLAQLPFRPAAHAGGAYPAEPEQLRAFLDQILQDGSVLVHGASRRAFCIPHIDLRRGWQSYAEAWSSLRDQLDDFDTFIVLGISHAYAEHPFVLTRKSFDTPLGVVETDVGLVEQLAKGLSFDPFLDEFNHLGEHSIEFQAIFLAHLCRRPIRIVPILCGSFQDCLESPKLPEERPHTAEFLIAMRRLLKDRPRTAWVASVDLAHVGKRFGGAALQAADLERLEKMDRLTLQKAVAGDAEGFLATLQADAGQRNYCGTSAIYTLLRTLEPGPGHLLHYQQCNEPDLSSTVTVASFCY